MKILIVGAGGQGGPCASILARDVAISEIRLGDIDFELAAKVVEKIGSSKVKPLALNAADKEAIITAAEGVYAVVNLTLIDFNDNILKAALANKSHYVDTACNYDYLLHMVENKPLPYSREFRASGKTALIGCGVELSELLFNMGLLSKEPVEVKGTRIVPLDLVLELCPPAPKYPAEIKAIIDEGVVVEEGAFLVRVEGTKDDRPVKIDCYVNAPGLVESFEKSNLSHEAYLTGQSGAVFVQMLVDDAFSEKGLFVPEQFHAAARRYCFQELAKLDITVDEIIEGY